MKKNKVLLIVIIIILVLVVALGGGFAFAYFCTDTFKSDKDLFFKYLAQNKEIVEILKDEDITNYGNKQKITPYTSDGQFKTDVTVSNVNSTETDESVVNVLKNCNISFSGNTDKSNNYKYQNINVNYSDTETLNIEYINNGDTYGAIINDVIPRFVMVENNNLKEWATTLGFTEEQIEAIPDKIDLSSVTNTSLFTEEEKEQLLTKYQNLILENLTDEMFSENKTDENDIYTLTLTEEQAGNLFMKLLETAKDDELLWNKIKQIVIENSDLSEDEINQYIQEIKDKIQETIDDYNSSTNTSNTTTQSYVDTPSASTDNDIKADNESKCTISVYVKDKNLQKTEVVTEETSTYSGTSSTKFELIKNSNGISLQYTEDGKEIPEYIITIEKVKSANEVTYTCVITNDGTQLCDLSITFNGINTLEQVQESYEFNINTSDYGDLAYTYKNTKNFVSEVEKKTVSEGEMWILNGHSVESLTQLFEKIENAVEQKNTTQMSSLGLESDENPMLYYIPTVVPLGVMTIMQNPSNGVVVGTTVGVLGGVSVAMLTGDNGLISNAQEVQNNLLTETEETQNILTEAEISSFNAKITPYLGNQISSSQVNALIQMVIVSNSTEISSGTSRYLKITFPDSSGTQQTIYVENEGIIYSNIELSNKVMTGEYYTVTGQYDENGYINEIIVTQN